VALSSLVAGYDQLILDLDGCVYIGDEPSPGAPEAIEQVRTAGKGVAFVTNDPRHSTEDYVRRLWQLGIKASLADVVTVGAAIQHLLAETRAGQTAYVIGTQAMRRHVQDAGLHLTNETDDARRADVVVVAGTDQVNYEDLKQASFAARDGAAFLAAGRDPTYPTPEGPWPGTGAILAAVERASGREAAVVGKPEPQLFLTALDRLGPGRTLVVGDRLDADVAAAARLDLDAALVLTGTTTAEEAASAGEPLPHVVAPSLAELVARG
jgi:glycerol 3-phosphatase-2